jgi:hypothetical protein
MYEIRILRDDDPAGSKYVTNVHNKRILIKYHWLIYYEFVMLTVL